MSKPTLRRKTLLKKLPDTVRQVQEAHPGAAVEVWTMDEHRIGLKPLLRRVWTKRGQRRTAPVRHRYQWMYVYGFVCPHSGQTDWWLLPTVRTDVFSLVLAAVAHAVGAGSDKQIILVLDGAGWHTSPQVQVPEGIHLVQLPPYSPELQPAERLWTLTNEPLVNRTFDSLAALEEVQAVRCVTLQEQPDLIRRHTLFSWWPQVKAS